MYHCHITVHEDKGMMKQFAINRTLYVDKDYTGVIELGTQTFPYKTLRNAVDAASEGTTIVFLSTGTHEEIVSPTLFIQKKIILKPNGASVTIQ
jgi:hypothetical protein